MADTEIDMDEIGGKGRSVPSNDLKNSKFSPTKGRNRLAKLFYCSYRPFMRCFISWELVDYLLIVSFLVLNVVAFYFIGGYTSSLKETGKHIGSLIQWMFLILLLPVTRNGLFHYIFGCSWERAIVIHKWVSRWALILVAIHTVLFLVYYYGEREMSKFLHFDILTGEVAGICMLILFLFSLPFIRRRFFQFFMKTHYLFFLITISLLPFHKKSQQFLLIVAVPLALYIIDELVRASYLLRYTAELEQAKIVGDQYVHLDLKIANKNFSYSPSQYLNLYIPLISPIQLHPFTVASSPQVDRNHLQLVIKAEKRWTANLFKLTQSSSRGGDLQRMKDIFGTIRLDGGYGALTIARPTSYPFVFLISGGVGVTPNLSLFKSIVFENAMKKIEEKTRVLFLWSARGSSLFRHFQLLFLPALLSRFYSSSSPSPFWNEKKYSLIDDDDEDISASRIDGLRSAFLAHFGREGEGLLDDHSPFIYQNYKILFDELTNHSEFYDVLLYQSSIRSSEVVDDDNLNDLPRARDMSLDEENFAEKVREMKTVNSPSSANSNGNDIDDFIQVGRPDLKKIFSDLKAHLAENKLGRVGVVSCGPSDLIKQSLRLSSRHSSPFVRFDIHHERFDI